MTLVQPDWHTARQVAHATGRPLGSETVPLELALGRTLTADVRSGSPLPPFAASAMDGWAVSGDAPWTVVGEVRAGRSRSGVLRPGEAVVIATGAVVPCGAEAVLRSEDGSVDGDGRLRGEVMPGMAIRPSGEEACADEIVIARGTIMRPAHLGLAAAAGADRVRVARRPTALILVLGDELLSTGIARDGRVRDSLGPQLPGWLIGMGTRVVAIERVADRVEDHVEALRRSGSADLIITTGGTAAGPVDFVHQAVEATGGSMVIDSVACRPGHPMLLAAWSDRWMVGLPGNPLAAIAGLFSIGRPLVESLLGRELRPLPMAVIDEPVRGAGCAVRLVPSSLAEGRLTPRPHIGSGMLRGLADADAFAVVGPDGCVAGDRVELIPLS